MKEEQAFRIRKFNGDLEEVKRLWAGRYGLEHLGRRETLFRWITEQNPFAEGENPYFLLADDTKVIGMVGHMPVHFFIRGEPERGYLSFDTLLDGEYRGRGLGKLLIEGVRKEAPSLAGALWFNEPNHRLYRKSGWHDVQSFHPYVLVLDPRVFLKGRIRNRALLNAASGMVKLALRIKAAGSIRGRSPLSDNVQILEANDFTGDINLFFRRVSIHFGVIVERSDAYLNWKFVHKPFNRYQRFVAYKDGQLSGYSVVKMERKGTVARCRIVDILADPLKPDVFRALVQKSMACCRGLGTSYIEIACTYPLFIRELNKIGFLRSREPQRFMVINWEGLLEQDFIRDISNWYLTFSEGDGDAWEADSAEGRYD